MATRAETRIESAKKRVEAAETRQLQAWRKRNAAADAAAEKHSRRVRAAGRQVREARIALAIAELAAFGITPMKTIILWHPKYSGVTVQRRYVVRVGREGWTRLVPVGKKGKILVSRIDQFPPLRWSEVTVTDEVMKYD